MEERMPIRVDEVLLAEIEDDLRRRNEVSARADRIYGVSDPDRWPRPEYPAFVVRGLDAAVAPDCSSQLLLPVIEGAARTLDIYIYDWTSGALRDAVLRAAARGVRVRVQYDQVGPTSRAERDIISRLGDAANIDLRLAPSDRRRSVFTVCHQKMAVADADLPEGAVVTFGSGNWGDSAYPPDRSRRKANREWMVSIRDDDAARWYAELFQADWDIRENGGPSGAVAAPVPPAAAALSLPPADPVGGPDPLPLFTLPGDAAASLTPLLSPTNYRAAVLNLIAGARGRVWVQQQYVKATPRGAVRDLMTALAEARERGADVRVVGSAAFDEAWEDTRRSLRAFAMEDALRSINLRRFTHCHNKGVLVDGLHSVVSSTNWSDNSVTLARETGALIESAPLNAYFAAAFARDWDDGWPAVEALARRDSRRREARERREANVDVPSADAH